MHRENEAASSTPLRFPRSKVQWIAIYRQMRSGIDSSGTGLHNHSALPSPLLPAPSPERVRLKRIRYKEFSLSLSVRSTRSMRFRRVAGWSERHDATHLQRLGRAANSLQHDRSRLLRYAHFGQHSEKSQDVHRIHRPQSAEVS